MNAFRAIAGLFVVFLAAPAYAQLDEGHPPLGSVKLEIEVQRILDASTVQCRIFLPYGYSTDATIQALGYVPAGPVNRRDGKPVEGTPDEIKKGKAAARALQEVFDMGKVYVEPEGRGKHDRLGLTLGKLWVNTDEGKLIDVAKWLKEKGHTKGEPAKPKDK